MEQILTSLDSLKKNNQYSIPYILDLEIQNDSMTLYFDNGMTGLVENTTLEYQGRVHSFDSLPINLGPIKNPIQLCVARQSTSNKTCFKKEY